MTRRILKKIAARATANSSAQRLLERLVSAEQWLMGIGAGGDVSESGEQVLVRLLREESRKRKRPLQLFDVGANKGQFISLLFGGLEGVPLHIHAFEPSGFTFNTLVECRGRDNRLTLNNVGLGRCEGVMTLHFDEEGAGTSSLYHRRLDHFGVRFTRSEKVRIETLDGYCKQKAVTEIDLLKLDVEGHELEVLRGAEGLFRDSAIAMVTFEFGGCNIDSRSYLQDFFYFFKESGDFELFRITPTGYLRRIEEYGELLEQFRTTNYLARRRTACRTGGEDHGPDGRPTGRG